MDNLNFNILHISDIHYSNKESLQLKLLTTPLITDLVKCIKEGRKPQFVVISGDLVKNPDETDAYYGFDKFFEELKLVTGLPDANFITCPGNHDVHWSFFKSEALKYQAVQQLRHNLSNIEAEYEQGQLNDYARSTNNSYFEYCDLIGSPWKNPLYKVHNFPDFKVSFVALNSTPFCSLKGSKEDKGRLSIPPAVLEAGILECTEKTKFLVFHHGLDQYDDDTKQAISKLIDRHFAVLFFGHMHDPKPASVTSQNSKLVTLQAGALYQKDERFKGYAIVSLTSEKEYKRIAYRTYFETRGEFVAGENICPKGLFYPEGRIDSQYWESVSVPIDPNDLAVFNLKTWSKVSDSLGKGLDDRLIMDTFIFPPLEDVRNELEEADTSKTSVSMKSWTSDDVLKGTENFGILIPQEFGATSLLLYLINQNCLQSEYSGQTVPIYLDIRDCKNYLGSVESHLKAAHPDSVDPVFGWKELINTQPYTLCIDNFEPTNPNHRSIVSFVHKVLPMARKIIATRTPIVASAGITYSLNDLPFTMHPLAMQPFGRREIRALVRKWSLPPQFSESNVVDEIRQRFERLCIPLTGPHISMYLLVLSAQKNYSPVNLANIVESFVEFVLNKPGIVNIFRGSDYRERAELLSIIAESMTLNSGGVLTTEELYTVCNEHYKRIGLVRNVMEMIQEFINARIFETIGAGIAFRYNVVSSFFVAYRMQRKAEFKEYIFGKGQIGRYLYEIDIYCGLSRDDIWALESTSKNYLELTADLQKEIGLYFDQSLLDGIELPRAEKRLQFFVEGLRQEIIDKEDATSKDKKLEPRGKDRRQFEQRVRRPQTQNKVLEWLSALRAYTVCLRNLDSIDHDKKVEHLKTILNGWSCAMTMSVVLASLLNESGSIEFAGTRIQLSYSGRINGETMRRLLVIVPTIVSNFLKSDLGTPNLSKQLKEFDATGKPLEDFLRTGLCADLKVDAYLKIVRSFFAKSLTGNYLLEAFINKMRDVYLRYGFGDGEAAELVSLLASAETRVRGVKGKKHHAEAARISRMLRKRKIIVVQKAKG